MTWHIMTFERVVQGEDGPKIELQVHVQVLDSDDNADSFTDAALIMSSLEVYAKSHPTVTQVELRSDNGRYTGLVAKLLSLLFMF